jgi:nitrate reductase NapE component
MSYVSPAAAADYDQWPNDTAWHALLQSHSLRVECEEDGMTAVCEVPGMETRSTVTLVSLVEIGLIIIFSALVIGVFGMAGGMVLLSILLICLDEDDGSLCSGCAGR